jgi:hypothetical protein
MDKISDEMGDGEYSLVSVNKRDSETRWELLNSTDYDTDDSQEGSDNYYHSGYRQLRCDYLWRTHGIERDPLHNDDDSIEYVNGGYRREW